jgi:hypothetical protein
MHAGVPGHLAPLPDRRLNTWQTSYIDQTQKLFGRHPLVERTPAQLAGTPRQKINLVATELLAGKVAYDVLSSVHNLTTGAAVAGTVALSLGMADLLGNVFHWLSDNYNIGKIHKLSLRHHELPLELSKQSAAAYFHPQIYGVAAGLTALTFTPHLSAVAEAGLATLMVASPFSLVTHSLAHRNRKALPSWVRWMQDPSQAARSLEAKNLPGIAKWVEKMPPLILAPKEHARHHREHSIALSGLNGVANPVFDGRRAQSRGEVYRILELASYKLFGRIPFGWREDPKVMASAFAYEARLGRSKIFRFLSALLSRKAKTLPELKEIRGALVALDERRHELRDASAIAKKNGVKS